MEKVKISFDPSVNSLIIWFGNPEEMDYLSPVDDDDELMLIKNRAGEIIGIERHFFSVPPGNMTIQVETMPFMTQDEMTGRALEPVR